MSSSGCAVDASPATAEGFRCVMPSCVETISEKGLRDVDCEAEFEALPAATRDAIRALPGVEPGFFDRACYGGALRAYDANTADLATCLERVRIQMAPCVGAKNRE